MFGSSRTRWATHVVASAGILLAAGLTARPALAQRQPRESGRSSGGVVLRTVEGASLWETGLAGFRLTYEGRARELGVISAGFFRLATFRSEPVIQSLLSNHGRHPFRWIMARQHLPRSFCCGALEVSGRVPRGVGSQLVDLPPVPPGAGEPVLQGFVLETVGEPRRVEEIGVELVRCSEARPGRCRWPSPDKWYVRVTLRQRASFEFRYHVQLRYVQDIQILNRGVTELPVSTGTAEVWIGHHGLQNPSLQGFRLKFENGRHKLHDLMVNVRTNYITATIADRSADDPFSGVVRWLDARLPTQ